MYCFITNSMYIHNNNKDFLFKTELFKWTIKPNKNTIGLDKTPIDKKIIDKIKYEEIIGIISPSNYRLLFELKEINYKKLYFPETYEIGKSVNIDIRTIDFLFEKYLKRSYISFLNYEKLQNLGLNRIEQYLILLNFSLLKKFKNFDNLLIYEKLKIISFQKKETKSYKEKKIDLFKFLRFLSFKYDMSFDEATKYVIYLYTNLYITDPFFEEGFVFLKKINDLEKKSINDLFVKLLKKEIFFDVFHLETQNIKGNKKEFIINKLIEEDENLIYYFGFQKEEYITDTFIFPENEINNIDYLLSNLKEIIPIRDIFLTLKSLLKLGKVKNNKMFFFIEDKYNSLLRLKHNIEWISKKNWEHIYLEHSYSFNNILMKYLQKIYLLYVLVVALHTLERLL